MGQTGITGPAGPRGKGSYGSVTPQIWYAVKPTTNGSFVGATVTELLNCIGAPDNVTLDLSTNPKARICFKNGFFPSALNTGLLMIQETQSDMGIGHATLVAATSPTDTDCREAANLATIVNGASNIQKDRLYIFMFSFTVNT